MADAVICTRCRRIVNFDPRIAAIVLGAGGAITCGAHGEPRGWMIRRGDVYATIPNRGIQQARRTTP